MKDSRFSLSPLILLGFLGAAILLAAPKVSAQAPAVIEPYADPVVGDHAEAISANPAGVSLGEDVNLSYSYLTSYKDEPGHGHALGFTLKLGDMYGTGLGYQAIQLPGTQNELPSRWSWAHSLLLDETLSMGLTWHHYGASGLDIYNDVDTWTMGMQFRPFRYAAFGLSGDFINKPLVGGEPLQPVWTMGMGLRPGTESVHASGFTQVGKDLDGMGYGARLGVELFLGLSLFGRYDSTVASETRAHAFMFGLATRSGVEFSGIYGPPESAVSGSKGIWGLTVRTTPKSKQPVRGQEGSLIAHVPVENTTEYGVQGLITRTVSTPFLNLMLTLRRLEKVPEVGGVLIDVRTRSMGWNQADELHQAIHRLKAVGKTVYAWIPTSDTRSYSAVCNADRVMMNPTGGLLLTGVSSRSDHIAGLLEKLGVRAQFIATGAYKTAPETFTRTEPSPAAIEVQTGLVNDFYKDVVQKIAAGRELETARVRSLIDEGPYGAAEARTAGLIDKVLHYDEFETLLKKQFGRRTRVVKASTVLRPAQRTWGTQPKIGIVYITGTITDGPSTANPFTNTQTAGSKTVIETLERFGRNRAVQAVVIRVDSPGGSVSASDAIWRAVQRLDEQKPVYVSMGDIAASGGYYVAASARQIFAGKMSLTGSIGVFYGKFDLSGLYEMIGVKREEIARGKHAGLLSDSKPWSQSELKVVTRSIDALYEIFLDRILEGRSALTKDALKSVAEGRVWLGKDAVTHKLVDAHKSFLDVLEFAAMAVNANPADVQLAIGPKPTGAFEVPKMPLGHMKLPPIFEGLRRAFGNPLLQFSSGQAFVLYPWLPPSPQR